MKFAAVEAEDAFEEGEIIEDAIGSMQNAENQDERAGKKESLGPKISMINLGSKSSKSSSRRSHHRHEHRFETAFDSKRTKTDYKTYHHSSKSSRRTSSSSLSDTSRHRSEYHPLRHKSHQHRSNDVEGETTPQSPSRHRGRSGRRHGSRHRSASHEVSRPHRGSSKHSTFGNATRGSGSKSPLRNSSRCEHKKESGVKKVRLIEPPMEDSQSGIFPGLRSGSDSKDLDIIPIVDDEERLIEERRRRRVEILMKHETSMKDGVFSNGKNVKEDQNGNALNQIQGIFSASSFASPLFQISKSTLSLPIMHHLQNSNYSTETHNGAEGLLTIQDTTSTNATSRNLRGSRVDDVLSPKSEEGPELPATAEAKSPMLLGENVESGVSCAVSPSDDMFAFESVSLDRGKGASKDEENDDRSKSQSKQVSRRT